MFEKYNGIHISNEVPLRKDLTMKSQQSNIHKTLLLFSCLFVEIFMNERKQLQGSNYTET